MFGENRHNLAKGIIFTHSIMLYALILYPKKLYISSLFLQTVVFCELLTYIMLIVLCKLMNSNKQWWYPSMSRHQMLIATGIIVDF